MSTIQRVLIANRGEIALRIVRACHEEGLEAVAVYSAADRTSPYVRAADYAVPIGPPPAAESYLAMDKLIAAAKSTGAEAIHPGYGFLAERATFANAVTSAGLIFVGPPADAIRAMGDKTEARRRMIAAGVPVVPGATAPIESEKAALSLARELGFPLMVKATAGGGARPRARNRGIRGQESVRRPGGLSRAVRRRPAARRDPGAGRRRPHGAPGRAGVLGAASASEAGGGSAVSGGERRASGPDGCRRGRGGGRGGISQRRHL
jgi:pyruvate carboxylase